MKHFGPALGRWVLGSSLVLGLGGCAGGERPASPPPASPEADATTTHDNVVATRRLSAWLLHAVPMPPGAREWSHSPTPHFRRASVGIGPSDPAFTRTTWWTVPLSGRAFGSWLDTHVPDGLRAEPGSGGPVESGGVREQDRDLHAPSTAAHTQGWVSLAYTPRGDGLVVRVDTFVGARFARTVLVPRDTTSVTISRTRRSLGPRSRTHTTVRTVTGHGAVADLVGMVDGLPGAMTTRFLAPCPADVTQESYSMTFATPHGTFVAALPTTTCWPRLRLTRDGVRAGPPLDPGRAFTRTADRYLR